MSHTPTSPASPPPVQEVGLVDLFVGFTRVGLSGFGGVLPWARRLLVEEKRWLSGAEFNTLLGLCQFLPGPNVVNLAVVVGARFARGPGAWSAVLGLLLGPMLIVMGLGWLYGLYGKLLLAQNILHGVSLIGAGLLFATAIKMAKNIKGKGRWLPFTGLVCFGLLVLHGSLPVVMLSLLLLAFAAAWWQLRPGKAGGEV